MSSLISIGQVLANHTNSSNPTCAAPETILAKRNNHSSQDSQQNHLRKQRHSYSLASNDVKGSRAEREQLRAKPETLTKGKEAPDDKNLSATTSASGGS